MSPVSEGSSWGSQSQNPSPTATPTTPSSADTSLRGGNLFLMPRDSGATSYGVGGGSVYSGGGSGSSGSAIESRSISPPEAGSPRGSGVFAAPTVEDLCAVLEPDNRPPGCAVLEPDNRPPGPGASAWQEMLERQRRAAAEPTPEEILRDLRARIPPP